MLPSPSSSPRVILADCVNIDVTPPKQWKPYLPTPPKEAPASRKRPAIRPAQEKSRKKVKTSEISEDEESEEEDPSLFEESDTEKSVKLPTNAHRRTVFHACSDFAMYLPHKHRRLHISTQPILRSFVSSLKTDTYACQSVNANSFLTPPYACAYTHAARCGGLPLLAVATEEGTVQIINTSRRKPWDSEPSRATLQPHHNGIFDVKWDRTDSQIVTCSGDQSSRITSVERNVVTHVLHGHTSTVKTVSWDPANDALLATGGRDGAICLWDLRTSTKVSTEDVHVSNPVMIIKDAHEGCPTNPRVRKSKKHVPIPKTVTSILYLEAEPYGLVSSGASDGMLRFWDLRKSEIPQKSRSSKQKPKPSLPLYSTPMDPTILNGSKRPRGIISLVQGSGPTAGLAFGISQDSRIHTYALPTLSAQATSYTDNTMQATSFYIGLSLSPCGNWLACGASNPRSSSFLFDVSGADKLGGVTGLRHAVELQGQKGEVGAVDWAEGCLATCADDGTVRVWRPDIEVYRSCLEQPSEAQWEWCWSRPKVIP